MHFPVFLDTCVLYPIVLTDTLLRVAEQSVFRPYWSDDVMSELRRNLALVGQIGEDGAARRIAAMDRAFPDAKVSGYEALVPGMECDQRIDTSWPPRSIRSARLS